MINDSCAHGQLLAEAITLWTGYGSEPYPKRNESRLMVRYGAEQAKTLFREIEQLEDVFFESDAKDRAGDLCAMGDQAIADFQKRYPELPGAIADCFAWCYTFTYK